MQLAVRRGFQTLRDSIPLAAFDTSKVGVESQIRLDAIWAAIDDSLNEMCTLAMVCPVGDPLLDEKMAAQTGTCRELTTYERVTRSRLCMALESIDEHSMMQRRSRGQKGGQKGVRFVPNLAHPKMKAALGMASSAAASAQQSSSSSDSAATAQPPFPPASRPYGNWALPGIIKKENVE